MLLVPGAAVGGPETPADAIRTVLASARVERLARANLSGERDLLDRLYAPRAQAPLWLDGGRLNARGTDALAALGGVSRHGLDPRAYEADGLAAEATRIGALRAPPAWELAQLDVGVSVGLVRLLSDLHLGRVDPRTLGFDYDRGPKRAELAAWIDELARDAPVGTIVDAAAPPFLENLLLEQALARYRALAADPDLAPLAIAATIRPRAAFAGAPRLARWLAALGDLPADATVSSAYDGALVEAVQRFQLRHGLGPDGVIGPTTARALAVPAAARARQIELALERLRWLPLLGHDRTIVVNVPGFEMLAFDGLDGGRPPTLRMPVVVGRAVKTETPFFADTMTQVAFAPYWNVPPSILHKEILPKLRTRPGYLAAEEMEIVSNGHVLAPTGEAIARLARGTADLRQRPGAKNALGRVKFLFPNAYSVYMHDTPAHELFARARRDFSHGCIRLADAPALARWVFAGEGMDDAWVGEMLAVEHETIVPLRRPITVVIAYATVVAHRDGTVAFYDDVYGHDAALDRALREEPLTRPTPMRGRD